MNAGRVEPFVSFGFAVLAAMLTIHHMAGDSATADEPVHIASAVEIVREGTGRWNPEHPPLAKALAGLALAGISLTPPASPFAKSAHGPLLFDFLYHNQAPAEVVLFRARLPFVALYLLLLFGLRAEARRRFGPAAGCAALAFAALEPNLIAHAGVVHTDIAVTTFLVLSLGPLGAISGALERRVALRAAAMLGLFWGLAFLSKYDAPLLAVCTLPFLALPRHTTPRAGFLQITARILLASGIAGAVTLAGFSLAYRNQTASDRDALAHDRLLAKGRSESADALALSIGRTSAPAANLFIGAESIVLQSRVGGGVNWMLGEISPSGSPFYFPLALATKITLGLFFAWMLGSFTRRGAPLAIVVLLGLLVFIAVSARSTYNIGVRHILFAFPFAALVAAASVAEGSRTPRWRVTAMVLFLGVEAIETGAIHPHELSFFNFPSGGLEGGRRIFVDSNLDWGQDLLRLSRMAPTLSKEPIPTIVFGGDLPRRYQPRLRPPAPGEESRPGLLAIGEAPLAIGPELLAGKGAIRDAEGLSRLRDAIRRRGTRIGEIGGSIGIWRLAAPSATDPAETAR